MLPCPRSIVIANSKLEGIPAGPIPPNTAFTVTTNSTRDVIELWRLAPVASTVAIQTGGTFNFNIANPNTYVFEVRCCDIDSSELTEQEMILQQIQPITGMLSRTGWGENATGGSKVVFVDNVPDLDAALIQDDNLVFLDPSWSGQDIFLTGTQRFGVNTTLSGRYAPGHRLVDDNGGFHFLVNQDNSIGHCLHLYSEFGNILNFQGGENHWWDHITISGGGSSDDGVNYNGGNSTITPEFSTFSNFRVLSDSFGSLVTNWFDEDVDAGRLGRITMHSSHLSGIQRNPKFDGDSLAHVFNMLIEDVRAGIDVYNDNGPNPTNIPNGQDKPAISQRSTAWVEEVHFRNSDGGNRPSVRTRTTEPASESSIFLSGFSQDGTYAAPLGSVFQPGDPNYEAPNFPYSYDLIDMSQAANQQAIADFAGADADKDQFQTGMGECDPPEQFTVIVT